MKIQFSAIIDNIRAKKDRTLSIKVDTQEMTATDTSYIFDLMNKQLWVGLAETPIESLDVPEVLPEMQGDKTPSQRLRNVIYRIWEQKTDKSQPFPKYYENYMSKLIENLKDKLS